MLSDHVQTLIQTFVFHSFTKTRFGKAFLLGKETDTTNVSLTTSYLHFSNSTVLNLARWLIPRSVPRLLNQMAHLTWATFRQSSCASYLSIRFLKAWHSLSGTLAMAEASGCSWLRIYACGMDNTWGRSTVPAASHAQLESHAIMLPMTRCSTWRLHCSMSTKNYLPKHEVT
jgi:hypothetical protein